MRGTLLILGRFTNDSQRALTGILVRLARLVSFHQVLCERHAHGRFLVWLKRVSANRAALPSTIGNQMRFGHHSLLAIAIFCSLTSRAWSIASWAFLCGS